MTEGQKTQAYKDIVGEFQETPFAMNGISCSRRVLQQKYCIKAVGCPRDNGL